MKKVIGLLLGVAGLVALSGCAGIWAPPPGGAQPAMVLTETTYPSMYQAPAVKFNFERSDIEILGPVSATSESQSILGIVCQGDNGYGNLMRAAKAAYPNCDGVMNIMWDTHYNCMCLGLVTKVKANVEGVAFRYKK
jgi:hypothetical protein